MFQLDCDFRQEVVGISQKHRDSKNDWRDSCEIKMNNLEFSQLLTNLKILSEIKISSQQSLSTCFLFRPLFGFSW